MTLNSHLQNSVFGCIGPVSVKTVTRVQPVERKPKSRVTGFLLIDGTWIEFPTTEMKHDMFADVEEHVEHSVQFADLRSTIAFPRYERQTACSGNSLSVHPLIILSNPRLSR